MKAALQVLRYGFIQNVRSRALLAFGAFFFVTSWIMLELQNDPARAVAALLQLVILFVPLVGFVYGAIYVYNSREFMEMLIVQPVARKSVYIGHYFGLTAPIALIFVLAAGLPFLWSAKGEQGGVLLLLLFVGVFLLLITAAIAYWIALTFDDRVKGLGVVLFVWLGLAFLYDGLLLAVSLVLEGYPMEVPLLIGAILNPLDLSRITVLLRLDVAALMGPTGAIFQKNLGTARGTLLAMVALLLWVALPFWLGLRRFRRKDF
jgi:Cu-processing system permease protein